MTTLTGSAQLHRVRSVKLSRQTIHEQESGIFSSATLTIETGDGDLELVLFWEGPGALVPTQDLRVTDYTDPEVLAWLNGDSVDLEDRPDSLKQEERSRPWQLPEDEETAHG